MFIHSLVHNLEINKRNQCLLLLHSSYRDVLLLERRFVNSLSYISSPTRLLNLLKLYLVGLLIKFTFGRGLYLRLTFLRF